MNFLRTTYTIALCASSIFAWSEKQVQLGGLDGFVERMGGGVRELGMGNVGVADLEATPGAFWNPALVAARRTGIDVMLGAEPRSLDRKGVALGVQSGIGSRMGIGFAVLGRGDNNFLVIDEDDQDLGTITPYFYEAYVSIGWRLSRVDLLGIGFSKSGDNLDLASIYSNQEINDAGQSPVSYNLGWHRTWNSRFESGVVIRNLGFNSDLSARWTQSPSRDNSIASSQAFRPKTLETGVTYSSHLLQQPISLHLEVLDYQLADTLFVFDPDWHYWTARMGAEWEAIPRGWVRAGYDSKNWSLGASYEFQLHWNRKPWPLRVHYALVYETEAALWNPLALGITTTIP